MPWGVGQPKLLPLRIECESQLGAKCLHSKGGWHAKDREEAQKLL